MRAILTYHSIDDSGSPISVPPQVFARHVQWLGSGAVRVTRLEDLLAVDDETDAVAITFDDGFRSVEEIAAPLLQEHGLPATVFVVTDHVGGTNAWGGSSPATIPVMPLLDWNGLARVARAGVSLGAHSRTHPDLTAIPLAQAQDEIEGSLAALERRTGVRPLSFAYPYGRVNDAVARAAAAACDCACTAELGPIDVSPDRWRLPRLDAYYFQGAGRLEGWGRPHWHAYVKGRAVLRRVRQVIAR